jgi:hypothetical protein
MNWPTRPVSADRVLAAIRLLGVDMTTNPLTFPDGPTEELLPPFLGALSAAVDSQIMAAGDEAREGSAVGYISMFLDPDTGQVPGELPATQAVAVQRLVDQLASLEPGHPLAEAALPLADALVQLLTIWTLGLSPVVRNWVDAQMPTTVNKQDGENLIETDARIKIALKTAEAQIKIALKGVEVLSRTVRDADTVPWPEILPGLHRRLPEGGY